MIFNIHSKKVVIHIIWYQLHILCGNFSQVWFVVFEGLIWNVTTYKKLSLYLRRQYLSNYKHLSAAKFILRTEYESYKLLLLASSSLYCISWIKFYISFIVLFSIFLILIHTNFQTILHFLIYKTSGLPSSSYS